MSGSLFFSSTFALYAFWAVYYFWIIAELGVRYLAGRHKEDAVKTGDRGSFWIIVLGIFLGIGLAFFFQWAGLGLLPSWMEWPGLALMLVGIALRSWAILNLGRFFSTRVELASDHQVVDTGPYRFIRHPAYTGSMITLAGMGLALGSWLSALLLVVIFVFIYSYRVRVEEAFLLASLGAEYGAYMEKTGRFLPRLPGPNRAKVG